IATAVGDPELVAEYFDSFGHDTEIQKLGQKAKDNRDILLDDIPKFADGVTEAQVSKMYNDTRDYLDSVGSSWGVSKYLGWLFWQGEQYQTNVIKVTYWAGRGEWDEIINPERTKMVLSNPEMVLFYPGLFRGLTDSGKQQFFDLYGLEFLSAKLIEDFITNPEREEDRLASQPDAEPFRPSAVFEKFQ
ncbi:hypothetical protein LCGC14_1685140, partial [marine sediment metagenome]